MLLKNVRRGRDDPQAADFDSVRRFPADLHERRVIVEFLKQAQQDRTE